MQSGLVVLINSVHTVFKAQPTFAQYRIGLSVTAAMFNGVFLMPIFLMPIFLMKVAGFDGQHLQVITAIFKRAGDDMHYAFAAFHCALNEQHLSCH